MTSDETSRDLDYLEAEVAQLKSALARVSGSAVPQSPRLGLIKMWAAGMGLNPLKKSFAFCPTGEGGGIDNSCSSGEPGIESTQGKWRDAKPEEFVALRNKTTRPGFLSANTAQDLRDHKLIISNDRKVGAAISHDGDIQNVFNNGGPKGAAAQVMMRAIDKGGRTLDCFDGFLPQYYAQFGFKETGRMKFNSDYAPKGWDSKHGQPDVVFMQWVGYPDSKGAIVQKLTEKKNWRPHGISNKYYNDWDKGKEDSRRAASPRSSDKKSRPKVRTAEREADTRSGAGIGGIARRLDRSFVLDGYSSALMGFDFADAETLDLARKKFSDYLAESGVDKDQAVSDAQGLSHSWEFATYAFCPTGEGGGIDNSCSPTGETGNLTKPQEQSFGDYTLRYEPNKSALPLHDKYGGAYIRAIDKSGNEIGRLFFGKMRENELLQGAVEVNAQHRRKGLASAMYVMAEKLTGQKFKPSYPHTPDAEALWSNPKRPFGFKYQTSRNIRKFVGLETTQSLGKSFMLHHLPPWRGLMDLRLGSPHLRIFGKYAELRGYEFCPTGEGGGIDPTCSPTEGDGSKQTGGIFRSEGEKQWRTSSGLVDEKTQARLETLKVPPAWKSVKLSSNPKADLQVTGIDKKGRKQAIYSAEHSERAAAEKFSRLKEFTRELPQLRQRIQADLGNKSLPPHEQEAAAVLTLIDKTGFRIGSDRETGADKTAFGASTLKTNHVKIDGDKVQFGFTGKKGVRINKTIHDSQLASILRDRLKNKGRLFNVTDGQVRDYLHSRDGEFKVKDFRTWKGTSVAIREIKKMKAPAEGKPFLKAQRIVAKKVARELGNTPIVALRSYIDPAAWSHWKAAHVK